MTLWNNPEMASTDMLSKLAIRSPGEAAEAIATAATQTTQEGVSRARKRFAAARSCQQLRVNVNPPVHRTAELQSALVRRIVAKEASRTEMSNVQETG